METKTRKRKTQIKTQSKTQTKTQKQRKKFIKSKCSPLVKRNPDKKPFSCYTDQQLVKIKNLWNSRHPDCKIR